ncbi:universal stress protein [Novosphingobium sp. FSY-8]|uniref:Universal stress protein n=1 Tax=Novosphingobium ovatum TaxID=1908523 RepID=A0ABW9XEV8_9SPHN|nr:universal stress protein [Novosphingobium ovatum]NBC37071.1 universal stress protein [Novosphingobium ovatum]
MRSIVVYADRSDAMAARLESALSLARATGGHISVLVDTPVARFMSIDAMGTSYLAADAVRDAVNRDDEYADEIAEHLRREDVPFDIMRAEEEPVDALGEMARLADVIVLSQGCDFVGQLTVGSRAPVLLVPQDGAVTAPFGSICVAWDGGYEAAAALKGALPLLKLADTVRLLTVGEKAGAFEPMDALQYLSRHGVKAELVQLERAGSIEETLSAAVARVQGDLLVMGAFGHSRLREFFMGGVTSFFLERKHGTALLLAH